MACHNQVQDKDSSGPPGDRRIVTTEFSGGSIVSSHLPGTLNADDCVVCHNHEARPLHPHQDGYVHLFNVDDPTNASSTTIELGLYAEPRDNPAEAAKLTVFCLACHDSDGANGDTTPFSTGATVVNIKDDTTNPEHDWTNASHNTTGGISCFGNGAFGCHGSGHGGQKLTLLAPAETGPGTNNSNEREQFCFNCHDGSPASNVLADYTGTLYTTISNEGKGASVNNRHDVMPSEQTAGGIVTCINCHQPHKNNSTAKVADPDNGATLANYAPGNTYNEDGFNFTYNSGGGTLNPEQPEGCATAGVAPAVGTCSSLAVPDYIQFCLACHDGTTPPGVTMTSGMINVAGAYSGVGYTEDQHGIGVGSTGSTTSKGGLKRPWVTKSDSDVNNDPTAGYAAMNCQMCHDKHGSGNIYHLRTSVVVDGIQMSVGGENAFFISGEFPSFGSTTYSLPVINVGTKQQPVYSQADHYWGGWCTFCHKGDSHPGKVEADSCTGGHMHGGGAF